MLECGDVASIPRVEEESEKYDEKKKVRESRAQKENAEKTDRKTSFVLRFAPCSLRLAILLGAAAEESPSDRVSIVADQLRVRPIRGNSAGAARAWLHRKTEHRLRVPICGGKSIRAAQLAAELVRLKVDIIVVTGGNAFIRGAKIRPSNDSDRYYRHWGRSCRVGPGRKPCPSRR